MNEDVIREFLLETHENLAQLDTDLLTLEKEPTEKKTIARVFRTLHSVKGTAGFIGLIKLQGVAHAAESLLSKLRAGELLFNQSIATAMLRVVDVIREVLKAIETDSTEGTGEYSALIQELDRLREGGNESPPAAAAPAAAAPPPPPPVPVETPRPVKEIDPFQATLVRPNPESPVISPPAEVVPPPPPPPILAPVPPPQPSTQVYTPPRADSPSVSIVSSPPDSSAETRHATVADTTLRVDVGLLDKLMTLVGELVLARNQIMQFSMSQENNSFLNTVQRLNLLTTELQTNVMKTRMQPIGVVWSKFPRVVRDLAVACGKQVRFEMEGQETELDKTIIEAIRDPLTHMIRNSVDHGIETPEVRKSAGKPPEGRLFLHAFHEGGKVIIEITDDGGGIDPRRIRDKAIASKILTEVDAARMSEQELIQLIFLPGFSTTDKVTHFSGRGVGMDVVRTNIEKIGGSVDIESRVGRGSTVKMKIPLTLAIIPALTISSGGERYCIPQVSLLELVRLEGDLGGVGIESIHGAPVYRLRGNLLPLVYLDVQLGMPTARKVDSDVNIVVLQADDRQFGLVVDAIHDTEEIVVKPLQKQIKGISVYAGATIMGDGRVALILDVLGLAQKAHVVTSSRARTHTEKSQTSDPSLSRRESLLLFSTRDGGRMAIPLSQVARLEEFPVSMLEQVGNRTVVQYRGEILTLIDVSRELRSRQRSRKGIHHGRVRTATVTSGTIQVVVYGNEGHQVGLVIGSILDIVNEEIQSKSGANRPGVLYTAVVQGSVTEFLALDEIIASAV